MIKSFLTKTLAISVILMLSFLVLPAQEKQEVKDKVEKKSEMKMDDHKDHHKMEKESKAKADKDSEAKIWNAYCPVMGDEVDAEVKRVEYKGKTIGFCCAGCIKKFNKAPEKYLKNLSPDGKTFKKN